MSMIRTALFDKDFARRRLQAWSLLTSAGLIDLCNPIKLVDRFSEIGTCIEVEPKEKE